MLKHNNRIFELDALRGLAALGVVLFHYTTKYEQLSHSGYTTLFEFKYGYFGVQLFFIISGFVIFMTITNIKKPIDFIFKRFIRLYPIFWICMTITFLVTSFSQIERFQRSIADYFINFTMVPSLLGFQPIDGVYWSLIPELFFYAFILIVFIAKLLNHIILINFIWLFLIAISYFIDLPLPISIILNLKYGMLFIVGINFYKLYNDQGTAINHIQILCALLLSFVGNDFLFGFFFLGFIIIFYMLSFRKLSFLNFKSFVFLGEISYSLYLIHQFIGYIIIYNLIGLGVTNYYVLIFCPLILSIGLAYLTTRYLEKPIIKVANSKFKKYYKITFKTELTK